MRYEHPIAASTCLFKPMRDLDAEFAEFAEAGIYLAELSITAANFDSLDLHRHPEKASCAAKKAGVMIRSVHLPFGHEFDNSEGPEKLQAILADTKRYINVTAALKAPIAVIHPGCEPNLPEDRERKLAVCKESLAELSEYAASLGVKLAVENLPRTCLGNCAEDMLYLLDGNPDLSMCFDTNHCLLQRNEDFLKKIAAGCGMDRIITVHVSDYDFTDEKHWLPSENGGLNNWAAIFEGLEDCGYRGPVMYEVSYTPQQIRANYERLFKR